MNLLFLAIPHANAFCGTYVATTDQSVVNHDSQVVVAMDHGAITLTLANDFEGSAADFGLVIPVPGATTSADVSVVDRSALDTLDAYSSPRLVRYSCDDVVFIPGDSGGWVDYGPGGSSSGCGGGTSQPQFEQTSQADSGSFAGGGLGDAAFGGTVETEHFTAGEYELTLVDASGASGLSGWLEMNGFSVPDGAEALLDEAITGGSKFLVAKVSQTTEETGAAWLSPIQIKYAGDQVVLPIRLGATSSDGEQDIVVYGITGMNAGALSVANYPAVPVESDCILDDETGEDLASEYDALFDATYAGTDRGGRAGWTMEFNSPQGVCDPLPPEGTIAPEVLSMLGFASGLDNAMLTRIHLRGTPDEIDQDLVLYTSAYFSYWQQGYIQDDAHMRAYFPVCTVGMDESASSCPEPDYAPPSVDDGEQQAWEAADDAQSNSCLCAGGIFPSVLVFGLAAARRRRTDLRNT